jgi:hypothetical protein
MTRDFFQMRIPLEHFCATPVFALSPASNDDHNGNNCKRSVASDPSVKYPSLINASSNSYKDKKMSLPNSLGLLSLQSAGSAPNSPGTNRRNLTNGSEISVSGLPTVSGMVGYANGGANLEGPISLPAAAAMITKNPYATLPKK